MDGKPLYSNSHKNTLPLWKKIISWFSYYLFRPRMTENNFEKINIHALPDDPEGDRIIAEMFKNSYELLYSKRMDEHIDKIINNDHPL